MRGQASIGLRAAADNERIERWSLRREAKALARTVGVVLRLVD